MKKVKKGLELRFEAVFVVTQFNSQFIFNKFGTNFATLEK